MEADRSRPRLRLVGQTQPPRTSLDEAASVRSLDVDWSILMARAQGGDGGAYARLLEEVVPFLRSMCAKRTGNRAISRTPCKTF